MQCKIVYQAEEKMWTAVVVTCPHQSWCAALEQVQ